MFEGRNSIGDGFMLPDKPRLPRRLSDLTHCSHTGLWFSNLETLPTLIVPGLDWTSEFSEPADTQILGIVIDAQPELCKNRHV